MSRPRGRLRKWAELTAWTLGVALVASYGATRAWSESARVQGLAAARIPALLPDQSGWSTQRVMAYAESTLDPEAPEGVLKIPSVRLEVPIYAGTSEVNLNRGAAHIEGTSGLTQGGNVGLAGHRDGFFRKLKDLRLGHEIEVEVDGGVQRYRVIEIRVVTPAERGILAPTRAPTITLVTCYPFYFMGSAPERYIVRAERR